MKRIGYIIVIFFLLLAETLISQPNNQVEKDSSIILESDKTLISNQIITTNTFLSQEWSLIIISILFTIIVISLIIHIVKNRKVLKLIKEQKIIIDKQTTELSQLVESLSLSTDYYHSLRDIISDALILTDNQEKIVYMNEKGYDIVGLKPEQVIDKLIFNFLDRENEGIYLRNLALMKEGHSKPFEIVAIAKDDLPIKFRVFPKPIIDKSGKYTGSLHLFKTSDKSDEVTFNQSYDKLCSSIISQSNDGILIANKYGEIAEWNSGAEKITNYKKNEILGIKIWDMQSFLTPQDMKYPGYKETLKLLFKQAIETGDTPEMNKIIDRHIISADNKAIYLQENNFIVEFSGDKYYCSIFRDNTNKKLMEVALFTSEKRFRELADMLPQPVFEVDINGRLTFLNSAGFELFDINLEDFDNGIIVTDFFSNVEKIKVLNDFNKILKHGDIGQKEYSVLTKSGKQKEVLLHSLTYKKNGKTDGFRGILWDITERVASENSIAEKEERYRKVFDNLPFMIGITRIKDQVIIDVNDTLCRMRAVNKKDTIGKSTYENGLFQNKEIRDDFWKILKKDGIVNNFKVQHLLSNNEVRHLDINARIIELKGEKCILSIISDVTEEVNFRKAIQESEVKYRNIFDTSPELIAVLDQAGIVLDINNQIEKLTGYTENEIIGNNIFKAKFIDDTTRDLLLSNFKARMSGKDVSPYNIVLTHKNGDQKKVMIFGSAIRDQLGNYHKNLIMVSDITEQIKAQEEIRKHNFLLENITNTTPMTIFLSDINTANITWSNKCLVENLGFKCDDKIMNSINSYLNFIHPDDRNKFEDVLKKINRNNQNSEIEVRAKDKNGLWKWLYFKFVPFRTDSQKENTQILGISFDISERKYLEESIVNSEKSLRELNATKDKFFSIISHDLRSPISSFLGLSELIQTHYDTLSEEEILGFTKSINDSAKKLYELLENLLQWSRIQTNRIEYYPEQNDISEIIENVFAIFELQAMQKNITLINEVKMQTFLNFDSNIIGTVLRNLISNAIKFSENNKIIVNADIEPDTILITVKDFGTGIDETILNNMFRIDKIQSLPGTNHEIGTGLGLIICKEFIELHQGKLWVETKLGEGTNFYFTLPM